MTDPPNIYVSNGTCFTGPDNPTDKAMIPCGNAYFQPQACCQHNDHCLQSSVCYNQVYGVTYIAGCTDKEYAASVCPDKFDDADAPWLGMSYCNDTTDDWVLCDQRGHPGTITNPDPCACPTATAKRSMTLNQALGIAETASLPNATGLLIDWNTNFYPTIPSALSTSSTSRSLSAEGSPTTATFSSTTPTVITTANPSPPFPTTFTTSAKIGTAIGASVFGILLLALLGFFILRHRRHLGQQDLHGARGGDPEEMPSANGAPDLQTIDVAYGSGTHSMSQRSIANPRMPELDNKPARPWSMVSELDGHGDGGCLGSTSGPEHMEATREVSHGKGVGCGLESGQGEAGPSELEVPHEVAELPA